MSYIYSIGFSTGAKTVLGPGHLTYSLGVDISGFISKNLKYSGKPDPPPSDMLIRSIAMAKIKVCVHTYLYFRELKCYTKKDNYFGFFKSITFTDCFSKIGCKNTQYWIKMLGQKVTKGFSHIGRYFLWHYCWIIIDNGYWNDYKTICLKMQQI